MIQAIRAVIFDFGNVLRPAPKPEDFGKLHQLSGIEGPRFLDYFWRRRLEYDSGAFDGAHYWRQIAKDAGTAFSGEQIAGLIAADTEIWQHLDASLLSWAQALRKAGVKVAVLSNMPRDIGERLKKDLSLPKQFDSLVLSGELRVLKPAPEIYNICLNDLRVKPEEALFIDDREENVDGARAVGIRALKFESVGQLAGDVAKFGLPVRLVKVNQP